MLEKVKLNNNFLPFFYFLLCEVFMIHEWNPDADFEIRQKLLISEASKASSCSNTDPWSLPPGAILGPPNPPLCLKLLCNCRSICPFNPPPFQVSGLLLMGLCDSLLYPTWPIQRGFCSLCSNAEVGTASHHICSVFCSEDVCQTCVQNGRALHSLSGSEIRV